MSSKEWLKISYTKNSEVPLLGEVILLRYPIATISFPYGPICSEFSTTSTNDPKGLKAASHHVLVCSVKHDPQNHCIDLSFMPIMSYSSPSDVVGSWDADRWMSQQATYREQLHHLPIPAAGWTPPPSPSFAPILSFRNWVNSSPAWLAAVHVTYQFPEMHEWCRHPDGPVILDGGGSSILDLLMYLLTNDLYGRFRFNGAESVVAEFEPITDTDIDKALAGDDAADPISFWNFPGAPKELRALAELQEKSITNRKVLEWNDRCEKDSGSFEGEGSGLESELVPEVVLDIEEVSFGEEAIGAQD